MTRQGDTADDDRVPEIFGLVGDRVRWGLLRELGRSDRQVRELVALVGQPQSLVSYHLGRLRAAGLVSMRRSSADGRDAYYRVELPIFGERLGDVGAALHPGLQLGPVGAAPSPSTARRRQRVLFLCTGNSARSQMAEGFVEHLAAGRVEACSAGSHPKQLHPHAVRAMAERGIDITGRPTKHLSTFARRRFDRVVSLCDRVREVCPEWVGEPETVHWSMADPSATSPTDGDGYPTFQRTAAEIEWRVTFLLARMQADSPASTAREKTR